MTPLLCPKSSSPICSYWSVGYGYGFEESNLDRSRCFPKYPIQKFWRGPKRADRLSYMHTLVHGGPSCQGFYNELRDINRAHVTKSHLFLFLSFRTWVLSFLWRWHATEWEKTKNIKNNFYIMMIPVPYNRWTPRPRSKNGSLRFCDIWEKFGIEDNGGKPAAEHQWCEIIDQTW
jgi:hypothetical protein